MATARNSEIISGKSSVVRTCSGGNNARKLLQNCIIMNLYFLLHLSYKLQHMEESKRHVTGI